MGKYIEMAKRNAAVAELNENTFFAKKNMILETEMGNLEINKGEVVDAGSDGENLIVREVNKVFVINDKDIARECIGNLTCKKEWGPVQHECKKLESITESLVGANIDNRVKSTVDNAGEGFTQSTVNVEVPLDPAFKANIIASNLKESKNGILVDAITIVEDDGNETNDTVDNLEVDNIQVNNNVANNVSSENDFVNAVNDLGGKVDISDENTLVGKVDVQFIGAFNKETGEGVIFPDQKFDNTEDLAKAIENAANKVSAVNDYEWEDNMSDETEANVEKAVECYECGDQKTDEEKAKLKQALVDCGISEEQADKFILTSCSK